MAAGLLNAAWVASADIPVEADDDDGAIEDVSEKDEVEAPTGAEELMAEPLAAIDGNAPEKEGLATSAEADDGDMPVRMKIVLGIIP